MVVDGVVVGSTGTAGERRTRSNGRATRERILDAAAEIAGELGYEGTSMQTLRRRAGVPASSIYWHFADKDQLIAAVIDRSYERFLEALKQPAPHDPDLPADDHFRMAMRHAGQSIAQFPDFLRLGLMLSLERRPRELTARTKFVEGRRCSRELLRQLLRSFFGDLSERDVERLTTMFMAVTDGLFVASQVEGTDLADGLEGCAEAILGAVDRYRRTGRTRARDRSAGSRRVKAARHT